MKAHIDLIFEAVCDEVKLLSMDPFGNYLIQKLLQYGTTEQRSRLVFGAADHLMAIALNVHGTRVVQKMVECSDAEEQASAICGSIGGRIMELIHDMNGNHVVQRCLASLSPPQSAFIYDAVAAETLLVATHRHGCCVLQRCLDHAAPDRRGQLIDNVVRHARKLVLDPFGNYVVQYVLDLKSGPLAVGVARALKGCFVELSLQKFSSNVIEKCLNSGEGEVIGMVSSEIIHSKSLGTLLHDPFANYVVQTLLTVGDDEAVSAMLEKLQPHTRTLRSTLCVPARIRQAD